MEQGRVALNKLLYPEILATRAQHETGAMRPASLEAHPQAKMLTWLPTQLARTQKWHTDSRACPRQSSHRQRHSIASHSHSCLGTETRWTQRSQILKRLMSRIFSQRRRDNIHAELCPQTALHCTRLRLCSIPKVTEKHVAVRSNACAWAICPMSWDGSISLIMEINHATVHRGISVHCGIHGAHRDGQLHG